MLTFDVNTAVIVWVVLLSILVVIYLVYSACSWMLEGRRKNDKWKKVRESLNKVADKHEHD